MICGGGIAGLAAAWEAVQHGITSICVLDQSVEMGGKLRTSEVGGELVDEGADAFLIRVPAAIELCGFEEAGSPRLARAWRRDWTSG